MNSLKIVGLLKGILRITYNKSNQFFEQQLLDKLLNGKIKISQKRRFNL